MKRCEFLDLKTYTHTHTHMKKENRGRKNVSFLYMKYILL